MINLVLVDDHKMVLNGLASMLKSYNKEVHIMNTFHNGKDLLDSLTEVTPDVLFLDINLPDINGVEVCKIVSREYPDVRVIALTNYHQSNFIKNMIRNGAKGYLLKNSSKEDLIEAIRTVMKDQIFLPGELQKKLLNESFGVKEKDTFIPKLTNREKEVLAAISDELTTNEIAESLFISSKTVETHRNNLLQKFDAKNTAGLIKRAFQIGLLN